MDAMLANARDRKNVAELIKKIGDVDPDQRDYKEHIREAVKGAIDAYYEHDGAHSRRLAERDLDLLAVTKDLNILRCTMEHSKLSVAMADSKTRRTEQYMLELEACHAAEIAALKEQHAGEMAALRAQLDAQRIQDEPGA
jgi:phage host-nuclease inhibitor protein Gam